MQIIEKKENILLSEGGVRSPLAELPDCMSNVSECRPKMPAFIILWASRHSI